MHGVQPMPNTMPSSGAPAMPVAGRHVGLMVRCMKLNCPMNTSPMTMSRAPATRTITSEYCSSHAPATPATRLKVTNTSVNPAMNSSTPSIRRRRLRRSSTASAEASVNPPRKPRYPGTSGSTHGDRNETSPAASAIGIAASSCPFSTISPTPMCSVLALARFPAARRPRRYACSASRSAMIESRIDASSS